MLHLILERASNLEEWKFVIETILDKQPGIFYMNNRCGETPASLDAEKSFGISKLLDQRERQAQRINEKEVKLEIKAEGEAKQKKAKRNEMTKKKSEKSEKSEKSANKEKYIDKDSKVKEQPLTQRNSPLIDNDIPQSTQLNKKGSTKPNPQNNTSKESAKEKKQKGTKSNQKALVKQQPVATTQREPEQVIDYKEKIREKTSNIKPKTNKSKTEKEKPETVSQNMLLCYITV